MDGRLRLPERESRPRAALGSDPASARLTTWWTTPGRSVTGRATIPGGAGPQPRSG